MSDDLSIPSPIYRVPRQRRGMDPATKRLALIACGLGVALVVVVGGWSIVGHHSAAIPVVQAESGPMRVKPANPGGMQISGTNDDILSGGSGSATDKLAPPPEKPDPQALRAPPPPPPSPAAVPAPAQATIAAAPIPAPAKVPAPVASPKPAVVAEKLPTPAVAPVPQRVAPSAKDTMVQFAAVSSEDAAREEWQRLSRRMPDLLGQRRPAISKVDRDGHALWRVRTGGFSDTAQATVFCERVRAKGAGCSVADF